MTGTLATQLSTSGTTAEHGGDHGNSFATATYVAPPSTTYGNIEFPGDVDYFFFYANAGSTYTITETQESLTDSTFAIYDSNGFLIQSSSEYATSKSIEWTATTSDLVYISVQGYFADYDYGTYNLTVVPDDFGSNASTAYPISSPTTIYGDIEVQGDRDYFSFYANAGTTYTFTTELYSLTDSTLTLYGVDGTTQLAYNDDSIGLASQITWTATQSGVHYISVAALADFYTGTYSLTAFWDDHGNSAAGATFISMPATVSGELEVYSDQDYFAFSAVAGTMYTFSTELGTLTDSTLSLYSPNGSTLLAFNDDYNLSDYSSSITWTATQTGTHFIAVRAYNNNYVGTYTLRAVRTNIAPNNINLSNNTVTENQPAGTLVGLLSASDPNPGDTFSYSLVSGAGADFNYAFQIVGNQLQTKTPLNHEFRSSYSIRVRVTDQGGLFYDKVLTVNTIDANDAPVNITLSNNSVPENRPAGTLVGLLAGVDPDTNNTFTYSLVTGAGSDFNYAFQIVGNQLQTKTPLNHEFRSSYSVRVRVTDQGGLSFEKALIINTTDVNDAPVNITLSNSSVLENRPAGTLVGLLAGVDPDTNNTFTYSLVSGAGSDFNYAFQIVGNQLQTKTPLNHEFRSSYSIRVRVTDQGGLSFEKTFVINTIDANDAPVNITLSNNSVPENQPAGTLVGLLTGVDPDPNNSFTYSLVTGTGSDFNYAFQITGNQLKTKTPLNYEFRPSYSIRVRVTDQGGLSFEKMFTINATNLNEAPIGINLSNNSVLENRPAGTLVGLLSAVDADAGNTFTYALVGGAGADYNYAFQITGNQLKTKTPLNYEFRSSYSIRVRVTDQGGLSFEKTFIINAIDVPE